MKRSGFKKKTLEEVKEKQASKIARTKAKPRKAIKRKVKAKKPAKTPQKGYKPPSWFMSIPYGSHGSTPTQKRYWKATSDFIRKRDFEKYGGKCVSCPRILADWKDGDCAHFKKYSVCNSWFKFHHTNLALSCKKCNKRDDGVVGHAYGEELKRRHHKAIVDWIETTNRCYKGQKMEQWEIVEKVLEMFPELEDKKYKDII